MAATGEAAPSTGYFVSLPGHEMQIHKPNKANVREHLAGIMADPAAPKYQGGWKDGTRRGRNTYLDASDHITDRAQAIVLGHVQQQLGVYDAANDTTLYMKDHPPKMPSRASLK